MVRILEIAQLTWSSFYIALVDFIGSMAYLINLLYFFVSQPYLKTASFSLLVLNLMRILKNFDQKTVRYCLMALYYVYCFVMLFLPYASNIAQLHWYEVLLIIPYLIAITVAGIAVLWKMSSFVRIVFNYWTTLTFYTLIIIIWLLISPADGNIGIAIIYIFILILIAGVSNLFQYGEDPEYEDVK